jgi:hypothetical protein
VKVSFEQLLLSLFEVPPGHVRHLRPMSNFQVYNLLALRLLEYGAQGCNLQQRSFGMPNLIATAAHTSL